MAEATKTISYDDYLRLKGLLVLATDHSRALKGIHRAAAALVGEKADGGDYYGHISDQVYGDGEADEMLRNMEITVEKDGG